MKHSKEKTRPFHPHPSKTTFICWVLASPSLAPFKLGFSAHPLLIIASLTSSCVPVSFYSRKFCVCCCQNIHTRTVSNPRNKKCCSRVTFPAGVIWESLFTFLCFRWMDVLVEVKRERKLSQVNSNKNKSTSFAFEKV